MNCRLWIAGLAAAQGMLAQQILTDAGVIKMVEAGVAQDIVLRVVKDSPAVFCIDAEHVAAWKRAGIPDEVVRAMLAHGDDGAVIQYVHFSSEVRAVPAKRKGRSWTRLKIW